MSPPFQLYQHTLSNPRELEATLELISHTADIIEVFLDTNPLRAMKDSRVSKLQRASKYFRQFVNKDVKHSFTAETSYDIVCTIDGLLELIHYCVSRRISVVPGHLNSDIIENHFSLVRGMYNGASDHPNYFVYKSLQNSIVLGQPTSFMSQKRNASSSNSSSPYIQPSIC